MNYNRDVEKFEIEGYLLHSLEDKEDVFAVRDIFKGELKKILGKEIELEDYHNHVKDDDQHQKIHYKLYKYLLTNQNHIAFFTKNQKFFESIMGLDVDIQIEPKFRISRPGKPQDNIGYHYDLDYGNSPYEVSCMINLTDVDEGGAVRFLSRSHAQPKLKTHPVESVGVEKGSIKHQLGVPYLLQRVVDESYKSEMFPIPFNVGEVLCFDLGILHGLEVSNSETTRFSIDCRLKSPLANSGVRQGYYKSLFRSPLAKAAARFYEANPDALEADRSVG